jgi:hypothetical protein
MFVSLWFEQPNRLDRRKAENRLKRIARAAEEQEESQIDRWLELADKVLTKDEESASAAA